MIRLMTGGGLLLALTVAACMLPSIVLAQENEPGETHVVILGTSDIHGNICCWSYEDAEETDYGMARLYTCVQETREETPITFLVNGGDELEGNVLTDYIANSDPDKLHPVIAAMNYMDYDCMTIGNHDFDWGVDNMLKMLSKAEFPVLAQNVFDKDGKLLTGKGWTIVERGGIRLAVIGVVTPNVPVLDGNADGVNELSYEDASEAVKKAIAEIKDQADIIMVSAHMGMTGEFSQAMEGDSAQKILDENPEIDVLQVGHYHITVNDREGGTVIGGVRNDGRTVARFDLTLDKDKNIIDSKISIVSMVDYQPDQGLCDIPEVREAHEAAVRLVESGLDEEDEEKKDEEAILIGSSTARFQPDDEIKGLPRGRLEDTPLVDLFLKVQLLYSGADVSSTSFYQDDSDLPRRGYLLQRSRECLSIQQYALRTARYREGTEGLYGVVCRIL